MFVSPRLSSGDSLVLQNANHNATVLRLSLSSVVGSYLVTGAHRSRRQNIGQRNPALLLQEINHVRSALLTQLLVQRSRANFRRISLHLDHVPRDRLGFLGKGQQLRLVLRIDVHLAVAEQHLDFVPDVVLSQLAKALIDGGDRGFVGGDLCLIGGLLFLLLLQGLLLRLLLLLRLRLNRSHPGLNVRGRLQRVPAELHCVGHELVLVVV